MTAESSAQTSTILPSDQTEERSRLYIEGMVAGVIGAATIAIWFLILDTLNGHPLYTPTLLGTTLFQRGGDLSGLDSLQVSIDMTLMYTWFHVLIFCVIGGMASRLLALAERNLNFGFGILLLFVGFEFGFIVIAFLFAEPVLHALAWPAVLIGNLLAAATMGGYFWRRHPNLMIDP
ncbi:MAG: hypothetical protein ACE5HC_05215 [Candidatus Binatia bacterium]